VLLATVSRFIHRCCSIRCSAIVPLQLHSYPLDDGRSTAEAAAAAARCGSASGLTHRPDINGRAEDQSDDFVCSMSVVVRRLHDDRAVPRLFAAAVELSPSVRQMFSMFSKCSPNVRQMFSKCFRYDRTLLHTTAGVHVGRTQMQQANDARHSFNSNRVSIHIVSGMPLPIACSCSMALRSGTCLAAHSGMQLILCLLGCSKS
jgi:hypothetical protein